MLTWHSSVCLGLDGEGPSRRRARRPAGDAPMPRLCSTSRRVGRRLRWFSLSAIPFSSPQPGHTLALIIKQCKITFFISYLSNRCQTEKFRVLWGPAGEDCPGQGPICAPPRIPQLLTSEAGRLRSVDGIDGRGRARCPPRGVTPNTRLPEGRVCSWMIPGLPEYHT